MLLPSPRVDFGLVVAMGAELVHLLRAHPAAETSNLDIWRFNRLNIAGRSVMALRSGMGLINAAAGTERLIAEFRPAALLNFGCSGAHRRDILPGDLVIGERVVHHSALRVLTEGSEEHAGFGYEVAGERMNVAELPADPTLLEAASELARTFSAEPWPRALGWPESESPRAPIIHRGAIASADIWTQSTARLDALHGRHRSLCEEMEAAAIAQVAARHGIPFLAIKDISNNEYRKSSDLTAFTDFPMNEVGKRAAAFTSALISRLAAEQQGAGPR